MCERFATLGMGFSEGKCVEQLVPTQNSSHPASHLFAPAELGLLGPDEGRKEYARWVSVLKTDT